MIAEEATFSSFNDFSAELGDGWRNVDPRLLGQALVTVACFSLRLKIKSTSKKQKPKSRLPMHWSGWLASLGDSSAMLWRVFSFWGCWFCCVCVVSLPACLSVVFWGLRVAFCGGVRFCSRCWRVVVVSVQESVLLAFRWV